MKSIPPPPSKESTAEKHVFDMAPAPFGDPLSKWQDSKQNLLVFGPSNYDRSKGVYEHDVDTQSVSTVSGSGMDFFRKFVQRKGPRIQETDDKDCKECESQFRREVLIDRLVTDALAKKESSGGSSSTNRSSAKTSNSSAESVKYTANVAQEELIHRALESSASSGKCKVHQSLHEDAQSIISSMSGVSESTVSGSGLLFLRNYLKKKTVAAQAAGNSTAENTLIEDPMNSEATLLCNSIGTVFNTVPIPFPPKNEFYGPAVLVPDDVAFCGASAGESRRNSFGSTIADLLNENFDSEDSELKNLDWDEWEEDEHATDFDAVDPGLESDDSSIVVDILDMAQPLFCERRTSTCTNSTASEASFQTETSEPSYEDLQNIKVMEDHHHQRKKRIAIPFLDLPSPPSSPSDSESVTPTAFDTETSSRTSLITPHQDLTSAMSDVTCTSQESSYSFTGARRKTTYPYAYQSDQNVFSDQSDQNAQPKNRLAEFWEKRVSGNFESVAPANPLSGNKLTVNASSDSISKFKPAIQTYYDPEGNRKANDKIQKFLNATRKAADDPSVSVWSSNYEKLKRGELLLPED